jgi:hypothetical protein
VELKQFLRGFNPDSCDNQFPETQCNENGHICKLAHSLSRPECADSAPSYCILHHFPVGHLWPSPAASSCFPLLQKDVRISGGASVIQQYLNGELVDELDVQIAPMFLEKGTRLFDHIDGTKVKLEIVEAINSPTIAHLHYRITKA